MPCELRGLKIFIASPSGLETERGEVCRFIDDYNKYEAEPRSVRFQIVKWEDIPPSYGRPQGVINDRLIECDYYLLMLWNRWGTPPGSDESDRRFTSGSEEEFYLAEKCLKDGQSPMQQIAVYFKKVESDETAEPGGQFKKVLDFKEKLEKNHTLLFGSFEESEKLRNCIWQHLAEWVRENETRLPVPERTVFDFEEPDKMK